MQDTPRAQNPLLRPTPPEGATVVGSGQPEAAGGPAAAAPYVAPAERTPPRLPFSDAGRGWPAGRKSPPADATILFMIIAVVLVVFPLLYRTKLYHCANDASRWNTVFYLVEYGTYEYLPDWGEIQGVAKHGAATPEEYIQRYESGKPPAEQERIRGLLRKFGERYHRHVWFVPPFQTVDMIAIKDEAGKDHYYSSKPPLLSAVVAGVVLGLQKLASLVTGQAYTFREHPMFYMRTTIVLLQIVPFLIMLWLVRQHVVRLTDSPFVQNFSIGLAAVGTFLTPYLIPLNNHVMGACCMMFALHAALRIWQDGRREWYWFVIAGLFGGLTFAAELPAAVFGAVLGLALFYKSPRRAVLLCLPMMALVVGAYFYTNYQVTGSLKPIPMRFSERPGPYDYEGSYWYKNTYFDGPSNIDAANEPKQVYLANLLLGHTGFFSLTPIFLLSLLGLGRHLAGGRRTRAAVVSVILLAVLAAAVVASFAQSGPEIGQYARHLKGYGFFCVIGLLVVLNIGMYAAEPDRRMPLLAAGTLLLLAGLLALYTIMTHNYAGVSQGPRWLFWVIPMWLLFMPAGLEMLLPTRAGRGLCYLLAIVSMVTVAWGLPRLNERLPQTDRPYTSTWIQDIFRSRGWINY